jgi:hypothetical protein
MVLSYIKPRSDEKSNKQMSDSHGAAGGKTPEQEDEQKIREIESKIEETLDILSSNKDLIQLQNELQMKLMNRRKHRNSKEKGWFPHNSKKNIAVNKHAETNMHLAESMKTYLKFLDHPRDLLGHLDKLTDNLLDTLQRQVDRAAAAKSKKKTKEGKK